ncbi:MAG: hypothetical protein CSA23_02805 [Deltaproteobacteria bacterium]|nr:MAG: hypothetical protein CSA23_02805 [Deltaproteobacteria bacterium]
MSKLIERQIDCFFIIREYSDYRKSFERYLHINKIKNEFLSNIDWNRFSASVRFVKENFLTFNFEDIRDHLDGVIIKIQDYFKIDFGKKNQENINRNASIERKYYDLSILHNNFNRQMKIIKDFSLGIL